PPRQEARLSEAVHHPLERRRRDARITLQPADPRTQAGQDRARPQEPLGTGHPRPRDARRDRRLGPRGTESARRGRQVSSAGNGRSLTANATMSSNDPLKNAQHELQKLQEPEQAGKAALDAALSDPLKNAQRELQKLQEPEQAGKAALDAALSDPLKNAQRELQELEQAGKAALDAASSSAALEVARIEYLGQKQGKLKAAQERLRTLDTAGKRAYGQQFNGVKQSLEAALNAARLRLKPRDVAAGAGHVSASAKVEAVSIGSRAVAAGAIDVTLPGVIPRLGHRHPLTQTADELIDLFGRFGFSVARGPEVEDIHHNFDALNIPPSHPA